MNQKILFNEGFAIGDPSIFITKVSQTISKARPRIELMTVEIREETGLDYPSANPMEKF